MIRTRPVFAEAPLGVGGKVIPDEIVDEVRDDVDYVVVPPRQTLGGIFKICTEEVKRWFATTDASVHKSLALVGLFQMDEVTTETLDLKVRPQLLAGPHITDGLVAEVEVLDDLIAGDTGCLVVDYARHAVSSGNCVDAAGPCEK